MKEEHFKELDKNEFKELLKKLSKGDEAALGYFKYGNYVITIKNPKEVTVLQKSRRFYQNRKEKGLCVYCGAKVKDINTKTNKPMRYCADHRKMESNLKKVKRLEGFLQEEKSAKEKAALVRTIKNLKKEAEQFLTGTAPKKGLKTVKASTAGTTIKAKSKKQK